MLKAPSKKQSAKSCQWLGIKFIERELPVEVNYEMRKANFLARLQNERQNWELLINYVASSRMGIGCVAGTWAVRDILSHIAAQEQYLADRLAEIARGEVTSFCRTQDELDTFLEEFGYPDFESPLLQQDIANDWVVNKYKSIANPELVALEIQAFDAIWENIQALTDEQLSENKLYGRIVPYTYAHYKEHAADIRKRFHSPVKR